MVKISWPRLIGWLLWCLAVGLFFGFCLGAIAVDMGWWVIP